MSETKRTPGKWYEMGYDNELEGYTISSIKEDGGLPYIGWTEDLNDARYICRAVNCHEELVRIAKDYRAWLRYENSEDSTTQYYLESIEMLIAEAEGGGNG